MHLRPCNTGVEQPKKLVLGWSETNQVLIRIRQCLALLQGNMILPKSHLKADRSAWFLAYNISQTEYMYSPMRNLRMNYTRISQAQCHDVIRSTGNRDTMQVSQAKAQKLRNLRKATLYKSWLGRTANRKTEHWICAITKLQYCTIDDRKQILLLTFTEKA